MELNHQHPEYVTWKYEQLEFVLLGGIRIEGLHSMRVTLKIDFMNNPSLRHSLDMYNEQQTEKLIKKIAERFSLSPTYVYKSVGHLINTVEDYRLKTLEQTKLSAFNAKHIITKEEQASALAFLKQKNLLKATGDYIGKSGVIGEELNRLIMYLIFTSRKTNRPLHIISFGSSGTGKSHLQEKVSELIPEEDKVEITSVSGNAFYYYDKNELGHKLILIEDYDGVVSALYPIRELQSKQKIRKTITIRDNSGNTKTLRLTVNGPVSISGCTTNESVYEDNANRSFLIYLDESEAQDERVMKYQRMLSAGKIDLTEQHRIKKLMQSVQRALQPITVINPYAEQLIIPKEVFKPRRSNAHYIGFIEAITFYKQYQREHKTDTDTGEVYIETTLEDIAEANELMKHILLKKADELGYATRQYFERLKTYLHTAKQTSFTNSVVRKVFREHPSKQKRYMAELQQHGLIKKADGDKKKGFVYEVISSDEYSKLQQSINTALDKVIKQLKGSSSQVVQTGSELLKPKPVAKRAK